MVVHVDEDLIEDFLDGGADIGHCVLVVLHSPNRSAGQALEGEGIFIDLRIRLIEFASVVEHEDEVI